MSQSGRTKFFSERILEKKKKTDFVGRFHLTDICHFVWNVISLKRVLEEHCNLFNDIFYYIHSIVKYEKTSCSFVNSGHGYMEKYNKNNYTSFCTC